MKYLPVAAIVISVFAFSTVKGASIFSPAGVGMDLTRTSVRGAALCGADLSLADSLYIPLENPGGWYNSGATRFSMVTVFTKTIASDSYGREYSDDFLFPSVSVSMPLYRTLGLGFYYNTLTDYEFLIFRDATWAPSNPIDGTEVFDAVERHQGTGGLSRAGINLAARFGAASIGVAADLYFGKLTKTWTIKINDDQFYPTSKYLDYEFSGWGVRLGGIFEVADDLNLAATLGLPVSLAVNRMNRVQGGDSLTTEDLAYGLPLSVSLGGSYSAGRLLTTARISADFWEDATHEVLDEFEYRNIFSGSLGFERLPLTGPLDPWYQKWVLRAGLRYSDHYVDIGGKSLNLLGFALGVGIPVKRFSGSIDLAFTLDLRGDESINDARERVIGLAIGWSVAERWFVRRKR